MEPEDCPIADSFVKNIKDFVDLQARGLQRRVNEAIIDSSESQLKKKDTKITALSKEVGK